MLTPQDHTQLLCWLPTRMGIPEAEGLPLLLHLTVLPVSWAAKKVFSQSRTRYAIVPQPPYHYMIQWPLLRKRDDYRALGCSFSQPCCLHLRHFTTTGYDAGMLTIWWLTKLPIYLPHHLALCAATTCLRMHIVSKRHPVFGSMWRQTTVCATSLVRRRWHRDESISRDGVVFGLPSKLCIKSTCSDMPTPLDKEVGLTKSLNAGPNQSGILHRCRYWGLSRMRAPHLPGGVSGVIFIYISRLPTWGVRWC